MVSEIYYEARSLDLIGFWIPVSISPGFGTRVSCFDCVHERYIRTIQ